MSLAPTTVFADHNGTIADCPGFAAAGRSGRAIYPLKNEDMIPLPEGSKLFLMPGRRSVGFAKDGCLRSLNAGQNAVAAFLPPGYTVASLAAFERETGAPALPLYSYCAVSWSRGKFRVPAIRVDKDPKHDPCLFDTREVARQVKRWLKKYPRNRLVSHHGLVCALKYGCPNAANLFLRRWEAPVAVSGECNAACAGCISKQPSARQRGVGGGSACAPSPQERLAFVPKVDEIVEIAVPHLEEAERAMISFGQGCEGEPLLRGELIESAIHEIRRSTKRGVIHLNTNGSRPAMVARLAEAGLNSVRVSLNSAREALYSAYYRCRGYSFGDVLETLRVARDAGIFVSLNYLTFPGVTDDEDEFAAFRELLEKAKPRMVQWRNLNIDPDSYMDVVERAVLRPGQTSIGIPNLMRKLRDKFPSIRFGYFNPPSWQT